MRNYTNLESQKLQKVVCNMCGKELEIEDGQLREGVFHAETAWGYFSGKDGEVHSLDLCEGCYDAWIRTFKVGVTVEESRELL